jgi:hypothetical protein
MKIIDIQDGNTWPSELLTYLQEHRETFHSKEVYDPIKFNPYAYDSAIYGLRNVLNNYHLYGYHCTRLTEQEIRLIQQEGMSLPNKDVLNKRIDKLVGDGLLADDIASLLKSDNQADEDYRENRLWFCFFSPYEAHEWGIRRFFNSWGGEALYNSHEDNPVSAPILNKIGIPCIIEANVPISNLSKHTFLDIKVARQYLKNIGIKLTEPTDHEDAALTPLPANHIIKISRYPEQRFLELTKCHDWEEPLI